MANTRSNPFNLHYTDAIGTHFFRPLVYQPSAELCVLCGLSMESSKHIVAGKAKIERQ